MRACLCLCISYPCARADLRLHFLRPILDPAFLPSSAGGHGSPPHLDQPHVSSLKLVSCQGPTGPPAFLIVSRFHLRFPFLPSPDFTCVCLLWLQIDHTGQHHPAGHHGTHMARRISYDLSVLLRFSGRLHAPCLVTSRHRWSVDFASADAGVSLCVHVSLVGDRTLGRIS